MRKTIFFFMSVVAVSITGCGGHDGHGHSSDESESGKEVGSHGNHGEIVFTRHQAEEAGLETETVRTAPFRAVMPVTGQILSGQGDGQAVAATSDGIVTFANASIAEGMAVRAGQTIATVSAKNIQNGDPAAKTKAAYEAARSEYERAKALVDDKIISQKELAQIKMQYETARVAYEAQAKSVTGAGIAISSPSGGYIKSLLVRQGEYVQTGQTIAILTQSRRLQLRADAHSTDVQRLAGVTGANFRMAGSDRVYCLDDMHGRLLSYGRSVSDGSPYIAVTFEFDNVGDIVAGAFADVWLLCRERADVVSVPVSALTDEQGTKFVYLQVEPEAYVRREVRTGQTDGRRIEITSGLKAGDKVVTEGAGMLRLASLQAAIPAHTHNH